MIIFCTRCGSENRDDSSFCYKCGYKLTLPITEQQKEEWEFCEVVDISDTPAQSLSELIEKILVDCTDGFYPHTQKFEAKAVSPKGPYVAAKCKIPSQTSVKEKQRIIDQMISDMSKDGWIVVVKGSDFYKYQLRRKIN